MTTETFTRPLRPRPGPPSRPAGAWRALLVLAIVALLGGIADGALNGGGSGQVSASRAAARAELRGFRALGRSPFPHRHHPGMALRERRAVERVRQRMPFISSGARRGRRVALTFDDGPGPFTSRLVHVLRSRHVPATFFQVGEMVPEFRAAGREVEQHFPVGDHSFSHPALGRMPWHAQLREVLEGAARLRGLEGARFPVLLRPPYASFDRRTLGVARRERMLVVLWDVDSEDYTRPGVRQIVRNVVSSVRPGSIVLMHDAGGDRSQTIAALPRIVRRLRNRGYRFVTVPRMMLKAPPRHRQKLPAGAGR